MRYLITMSYDGSKFYGFQRQSKLNTVQKKIEDALTKINKNKTQIKGAGRTDRGVHALAAKAHFDLTIDIESNALKEALNSRVGDYIYIKDCKIVSDDFHSRFDVVKKEYVYKINIGEYQPTLEDYTLQINYKLDIKKMKKCAKIFIGVHNFESFVCGKRDNYKAIIYDIKIKRIGSIIYIKFTGKSFYRYMIRTLVGALLEVGKGNLEIEEVKKMLESDTGNVEVPVAKPNGLYLFDVKYD